MNLLIVQISQMGFEQATLSIRLFTVEQGCVQLKTNRPFMSFGNRYNHSNIVIDMVVTVVKIV